MSDVQRLIRSIQQARDSNRVPAGDLALEPPVTDDVLAELRLEMDERTFDELRPLLDVTAGFEIASRNPVSAHFGFPRSRVQGRIFEGEFPQSVIFTVGHDFLIWDVANGVEGGVYFTCQEYGYHCLSFESLIDCLEFLLTSSSPLNHLEDIIEDIGVAGSVGDFESTDADLQEFVAQFPEHFRLYDLRGRAVGVGFEFSDDGGQRTEFSRWKTERFWVASCPEPRPPGWMSRLLGVFHR